MDVGLRLDLPSPVVLCYGRWLFMWVSDVI